MKEGEPKIEDEKNEEAKKALGDFFTGHGNKQKEVFIDSGETPDSLVIKAIIKPNESETENFPKDFYIQIGSNTSAVRVPERDDECKFGKMAYIFVLDDA